MLDRRVDIVNSTPPGCAPSSVRSTCTLNAERAEKLPPLWPADRPLAQRRAFNAANRLPAPSCLRARGLKAIPKDPVTSSGPPTARAREGKAAPLAALTSSRPLLRAQPRTPPTRGGPRARARTRAGGRAGRRAPRARRAPPAARSTVRPGGARAAPAPRAAAGPPPRASPRRLRARARGWPAAKQRPRRR
jgi:hypothetical protein